MGGAQLDARKLADDIQYVIDPGLIERRADGLNISNTIYREIILREMTGVIQLNFESKQRVEWYLLPDGRLDIDKLLEAFHQFFHEHAAGLG